MDIAYPWNQDRTHMIRKLCLYFSCFGDDRFSDTSKLNIIEICTFWLHLSFRLRAEERGRTRLSFLLVWYLQPRRRHKLLLCINFWRPFLRNVLIIVLRGQQCWLPSAVVIRANAGEYQHHQERFSSYQRTGLKIIDTPLDRDHKHYRRRNYSSRKTSFRLLIIPSGCAVMLCREDSPLEVKCGCNAVIGWVHGRGGPQWWLDASPIHVSMYMYMYFHQENSQKFYVRYILFQYPLRTS